MSFIDLSVLLNEKTPVYPGDPITKIESGGNLQKDGYEDHYLCVGTHVGTHVDAPSHMLVDGTTLDMIPPERFTGHGVLISTGKEITLEKVATCDIHEGDIVIFHTGMSDLYHQSAYYDAYPSISEEIAEYLISKKVKMVGVDMCSVDHEPFPVHRMLLGQDILIIENLTNLKELANKDFKIYAFPLKTHLDGSPTRVVAEVLE